MNATVRPLVVGLTGGIASGKTTVSDLFAEHGVTVIDADVIARQVVEPGTDGLSRLAQLAGEDILNSDGELDRARLRDKIFADKALRASVESLLHPLIRERMNEQVHEVNAEYCIMAIPLLVESGRHTHMDRVLVVDVPETVQRERLMARDGSTPEQVEAILLAQASRQERLAIADDVIDNSGSLAELEQAVSALHRRYLKMARRSRSSTIG